MAHKIRVTFICLISFVLVCCETSDNSNLCDPTPQFDIDLFVQNVQNTLDDPNNPVSGYQFVVNRNGMKYHSEANGFARHENDTNGPFPMTETTQVNVASVSKFIGAIALVKALGDNNISLDDNVVDWFPDFWQPLVDDEFSNEASQAYLTFRKLLRMETAIRFSGAPPPSSGPVLSEFDMLVSLNLSPDFTRIGRYQNSNFTLIRVLIGEIVYNFQDYGTYSTTCTEKYFDYLNENIFSPLNISTFDTPQQVENYYDNSFDYPYAYQYPFDENFIDPSGNGNLGWAHTASPFLDGGSSGLILSALDVAKILAFFKHDNTGVLLSTTQRNEIMQSFLGLYETIENGEHGVYLAKGGTRGPDGRSSEGNCCDRAIRSQIMMFPNGVEAVIVTNSWLTGLSSILRTSFDAAWVNPCN